MANKKLSKLLILYSSYIWFITLAGSILPTIVFRQGITLNQMIIGIIFALSTPVILIAFAPSFKAKTAWRIAITGFLIYVFLSVRILNVYQFYFSKIISAISIYFFWVFYNITHFENTPKHRTGLSSAIIFVIPPIIAVVAPLLAGYMATKNILFFLIFVFISYLLVMFFINYQEDFVLEYSLPAALREIKSTRIFILIHGIWDATIQAFIPIFSLHFIRTPLNYGAYLGYLGLIGVIANLTLGHHIDKIKKRSIFLYPLSLAISLATFSLVFAIKNLTLWIIVTGIIQFLNPIFWNIITALVVDAHQNLRLAMPGREFVLNTGRVIGVSMILVSFILEPTPHYLFYILGGTLLVLPILLFWNTKITKKHTYL